MSDRVERELAVRASVHEVWEAVTGDGWLADRVELELRPGGEARFRSAGGERRGWIEEVRPPTGDRDLGARLSFWWAQDDQPASRVELTIDPLVEEGECECEGERVRVRVSESRPLDVLDLVGIPLPGTGTGSYGPALVAA
jgi:uncharacterized protein YndB with AHSA1/START domain